MERIGTGRNGSRVSFGSAAAAVAGNASRVVPAAIQRSVGGKGGIPQGVTPWGNTPPENHPSVGKRWIGNQPVGEGWKLLTENAGWQVWQREPGENGWRMLKLVSKVRRSKANFWLGSNGERFANGSDFLLLTEHYPETAEWLADVLRGAHG